jgi:8-oxo-dGTP diphosphatase
VRTNLAPAARLYVVRHAEAGIRVNRPDDHLRLLTPEGRERARVLADLLEARAVGEIVSSPFARCVETVEPLASRRRRQIVCSDELAEGVEVTATLGLLRSLPDGSVMCTHGDVMTKLAAELEDARDRRDTEIEFGKGVLWVLARDDVSLSLVDDVGPSTGPPHRSERTRCACAASHPRPDGRRSLCNG